MEKEPLPKGLKFLIAYLFFSFIFDLSSFVSWMLKPNTGSWITNHSMPFIEYLMGRSLDLALSVFGGVGLLLRKKWGVLCAEASLFWGWSSWLRGFSKSYREHYIPFDAHNWAHWAFFNIYSFIFFVAPLFIFFKIIIYFNKPQIKRIFISKPENEKL